MTRYRLTAAPDLGTFEFATTALLLALSLGLPADFEAVTA